MNSQKGFLVFLVGSLLLIAGLMLKPFLGYLLGAFLLAFILMPIQDRLSEYIGSRMSAFALIISTFLLTAIPFILVISAVAGDASDVLNQINQSEIPNFNEIEKVIEEYTGSSVDIESEIKDRLSTFISVTIGSLSSIITLISRLAIGFSVMLFAVFYLLKDGRKLTEYIEDLIPLPDDIINKLHKKTYNTTWAVIKGHILVAVSQGIIAGIGLWIFGIPNVAFWTFIMVLLAFIPIIGAFIVWGPAGIYLITIGKTTSGIALLIYGAVVVSLTDNFLRPLLVDKSSELHPAVILIGVIGGVYVFGATGLFIGPVIFAALKSALEVFKNNYNEL